MVVGKAHGHHVGKALHSGIQRMVRPSSDSSCNLHAWNHYYIDYHCCFKFQGYAVHLSETFFFGGLGLTVTNRTGTRL